MIWSKVVVVVVVVYPSSLSLFIRSSTLPCHNTLVVDVLREVGEIATSCTRYDRIWKNDLPPAVKRDLGGQSREYRDSKGTLYFMFILALVFIYLVLSAQFESFVDPLTILLSVPLAIFGFCMSRTIS